MANRPNAHDALLGATSELTYARGITGTGVDAIAAQAGVTKRTLYQHFGSKDQLVAEALSERRRRGPRRPGGTARRRCVRRWWVSTGSGRGATCESGRRCPTRGPGRLVITPALSTTSARPAISAPRTTAAVQAAPGAATRHRHPSAMDGIES